MADPLNPAVLAHVVSLIFGLSLNGAEGPFPLPRVEFLDQGELALYEVQHNRIVLPQHCADSQTLRCRGLLVHELSHWLLVQHRFFGKDTDPDDQFDAELAARYAEECVLLRQNDPPEYPRLRSAIRNGWRPPSLPNTGRCEGP
jgi:hypothetical protein